MSRNCHCVSFMNHSVARHCNVPQLEVKGVKLGYWLTEVLIRDSPNGSNRIRVDALDWRCLPSDNTPDHAMMNLK